MELIRASEDHNSAETRDTILMFSGLALMTLGAGLILTTPAVRRYLGGFNVGGLLHTVAPDVERYLKLKAM